MPAARRDPGPGAPNGEFLDALNGDGMALCNPRYKEPAHRAEMEGIATEDRARVTCPKCLSMMYKQDKAGREGS